MPPPNRSRRAPNSPPARLPRTGPNPSTWDLTVILPARASADGLRLAVVSAVGQTPRPASIVVVDHGPTDAARDEVLDFCDRLGVDVIVRARSMSMGAARQLALENVRTRWTAFLDSDDWWLPGHLAQARDRVAGLKRVTYATPALIQVASGMSVPRGWYRSAGPRVAAEGRCALAPQLPWPELIPSTWIATTVDVNESGGFASRSACEDIALWWRMVEGGARVVRGPDARACSRWHPGPTTAHHEAQRRQVVSAAMCRILATHGCAGARRRATALLDAVEADRWPPRTPLRPAPALSPRRAVA